MKLKYALTFLFATLFFSLNAQLQYGFKTGLNFSKMSGPSELDDAGVALESWENTTGFHIGATIGYSFSDNYSLRAEVLYSKRGAKYTFNGQSYRVFRYSNGQTLSTGNSNYLINVNNSYIDIPLLAVARWGDFEVSAGGYVGFLVGSTGDGSLRYSGKTVPLGNAVRNLETNADELVYNLNHNYNKDNPGEGEGEGQIIVKVDARNVEMPQTLGAYYDYPEDKGSLYSSLDYGLVGGMAYYVSSALYIGARLQYGLADITNNDADLSKARINVQSPIPPQIPNESYIYRADKDKSFVIQASVGFSF
jgi:hypothetical protein